MKTDSIVMGGGCFWCLDAVFSGLKGVQEVVAGYAGGETENPTYYQVCSGKTGHAEVVQVVFDPAVVSLKSLFQIFFTLHDPTTLNRQGADVGTQYRSIILTNSAEQRETAQEVMQEIADAGVWDDALVTEVAPLERFYEAEAEHQGYFAKNSTSAYCQIVIAPKVAKLRKEFYSQLAV